MRHLTSVTITDDQIRAVLRETRGCDRAARQIRQACRTALDTEDRYEPVVQLLRQRARAFVAAVWNYRRGHR